MTYKRVLFDTITPIALYENLKTVFPDERLLFFESGVNNQEGNFSYVFAGVEERVWHENGKSYHQSASGTQSGTTEITENPLLFLKERFSAADSEAYRQLSTELGIGFVDGFVGFVSYDAVKLFEPVLKKRMDPLVDVTHTPDIDLIRPKYIFVYSHKNRILTALSALENSENMLENALTAIKEPIGFMPLKRAVQMNEGYLQFDKGQFFDKVQRAKEEIRNGEVFQILIANRYTVAAEVDPFSFYRVLRSKNPSPYQFFLPYDHFAIVGCSPEKLVSLHNGQILLCPIAGTRKRGSTYERDNALAAELLADEKERAEHIMLVDLGRNDVGRTAKAGTVRVENLMHIERFSHVMHIVSDIYAVIDEGKDQFDLFMSAFSAGTMTGAPKIRAMELIAELEGTKRGFYSGAIVLFGFTGDMDSAIAIRSAQIDAGRAIFHAGAGIVADSKPELEYLEVANKMAAMRSSLEDLLR